MRQRNRRPRNVKSAHSSGSPHDRWMITYADLITLLLIFFVMMYAMSRLDASKYEEVTSSLQTTFQSSSGILDGGNGVIDYPSGQNGNSSSEANQPGSSGTGSDMGQEADGGPLTERESAFREQEKELQDLMALIEDYIRDHELENLIFVVDKPQGISITLSEQFLFRTGDANLMEGAGPVLSQLASLFRDLETTISIEGHTDNTPVTSGSKYRDNWELSGERALSVLRYFIEQEGLDPDSFQYAGYADNRPAAENTTAAGRQQNRRVEITVLRQLQSE